MDFRHLNFICNLNSLCLSDIENCFCLISSGASQFSVEVQWLLMLYEMNGKLQHKVNLVQQGGSHFPSPVFLKLIVHSVLGTLRDIYLWTWVLWLYLHKNWIGGYPSWFRKWKQREKLPLKVLQQEDERRKKGWKSSPPDLQGQIMYFTLPLVDKIIPHRGKPLIPQDKAIRG